MSPPTREGSAPSINPFELGRTIGEVHSALTRIEERLSALPCSEHLARLTKLSLDLAAVKAPGPGWLERNGKWLLPLVLAALATPTVRQCLGDQHAAKLDAAVRQLEQRPATKTVVVPGLPMPMPAPAPKEETP